MEATTDPALVTGTAPIATAGHRRRPRASLDPAPAPRRLGWHSIATAGHRRRPQRALDNVSGSRPSPRLRRGRQVIGAPGRRRQPTPPVPEAPQPTARHLLEHLDKITILLSYHRNTLPILCKFTGSEFPIHCTTAQRNFQCAPRCWRNPSIVIEMWPFAAAKPVRGSRSRRLRAEIEPVPGTESRFLFERSRH